MVEFRPEEFDLKGSCSTGMTSDWEKSCENEILGLTEEEEIPQFSEQRSTAISLKTFKVWNLKPQTRKEKENANGV